MTKDYTRELCKMSFDPAIARDYGTDEAIIYRNIRHWVIHNELQGTNYYNGQYWTYNTLENFAKVFIWLSVDQIKRALKKLETAGLIVKGNFNRRKWDKTGWYTITDWSFDAPEIEQENPQAESPHRSGDLAPIDQAESPITTGEIAPSYIKGTYKKTTDNKTVIGTQSKKDETEVLFEELREGELRQKVIAHYLSKGFVESVIEENIVEFIAYWNEKGNGNGNKKRWQAEKFFEVSRRLGTWFKNIRDDQKAPKTTKAPNGIILE